MKNTFHLDTFYDQRTFYHLIFSLEKKELTIEKIANVVTDTIMRFYDTNIQLFDAITLKTSLLFFLYSVCNEDKVSNILPLHK